CAAWDDSLSGFIF
nr:immunoglobulin light chain junction region [Macaca mulatta]MPO03460.1 immunoglobulin light chain junction region [Macaca mulatta]MPO03643.1 immunoglobulin light chain junction region [Macaca mulatta]MPO03655.1 immunoglobulin light chain junction region [Macaca mulatta]MPO04069.1 immunoglobulin light chain junction region [Macaca mulatta]